MPEALRHARLLHYLLIGLSIGSLLMMVQRSPLAETYERAQTELQVLEVLLGRVPPGLSVKEFEVGTERTRQARDLITSRVNEHVYSVLSRSLQMGMGGDFSQILVTWEVPIAYQSQLPPEADLMEIRSHFSAIPILVLQPDLGELAWLLTSRMSAEEIAGIRKLHIRLNDAAVLENHVRRSGFISGEEAFASQLELEYTTEDGKQNLLQSKLHAHALRMPDLDQGSAFHVSFAYLARVFHFVEFQTPEQAAITLAERRRNATGSLWRDLAISPAMRPSILVCMPLFMLLLLGHTRHLVSLLDEGDSRSLATFPWFPLFLDSNSRTFGIITMMLLPGAGALAWIAADFIEPRPIQVEDILLHSLAFAVSTWIGSSILSEIDQLRNAAEEELGAAPTDDS